MVGVLLCVFCDHRIVMLSFLSSDFKANSVHVVFFFFFYYLIPANDGTPATLLIGVVPAMVADRIRSGRAYTRARTGLHIY